MASDQQLVNLVTKEQISLAQNRYGPLVVARVEGAIVFQALLRRMPTLTLESTEMSWNENLGFRGFGHPDLATTRANDGHPRP